MIYKIDVSFDSETVSVAKSEVYFQVLEKYDALGIGHRHTSTMFISSRKKLNLEEVSKDLGDIPVLSVKKFA